MISEDIREVALRPGLIWGFDFLDDGARAIQDADLLGPEAQGQGFRWLHFNLADQRTLRWLTAARPFPPRILDILLSEDTGQQLVVDEGQLGLVLHDVELEFEACEPAIGVFRIAVGPAMIITARRHPLRSAEAIKRRIDRGARVSGAAGALELVFSAMVDAFRGVGVQLEASVQAVEDELLKDRPAPDAKTFINMRSLMVRMRRLYGGLRSVLGDALEEPGISDVYAKAASAFVASIGNLDAELLAIQSQLRLLRDELDLQATQQTNKNLYFLSILTALLMPATLVTGIFGMNTGGLPWTSERFGSGLATGLALGSALVVYLALRVTGFIRR